EKFVVFVFLFVFYLQFMDSVLQTATLLSDPEANSLPLRNVIIDTSSFHGLKSFSNAACNTYFIYYAAQNNFQCIIATDGSAGSISAGFGIFSPAKFALATRLPDFTS